MEDALRLRYQIPPLTLRTFDGRSVSVWDFKQKRNRVIVLLADSPASWDFLKQLVAHAAAWKEKEAVALVVFQNVPLTGLPGVMPSEVVVGTDTAGNSIARYLGPEALASDGPRLQGVFVADRYGELYAKWIVEKDGKLPSIPEILKALDEIEIACEECQPSTWPLEG
jgi:hypothetical protein